MKHIVSRVRKAVEDYDMIKAGDKIGVGISGGNIEQAGVGELCDYKINGLMEMLDIIL